MTTLREAAQAVLDRWDSPAWEWLKQGPTAALMSDLRAALAEPVQEPLTEKEIYAAIKGVDSLRAVEVARAIERAHGIGGSHV